MRPMHAPTSDERDPAQPRLMIVIGSTRPGRVGLPVAEWVAAREEKDGRFLVDLADLAAIDLPFLDEPEHPRLRRYTKPHTIAWSERVAAADAFVFVTPEYNHGFTAPLKNAIDYLVHEWAYKPVGFVSYGGASGGTRAVQLLKPVLTVLRLVPLAESVTIPAISGQLDEAGRFGATEAQEKAAATMFEALDRWVGALQPLRQATDGHG